MHCQSSFLKKEKMIDNAGYRVQMEGDPHWANASATVLLWYSALPANSHLRRATGLCWAVLDLLQPAAGGNSGHGSGEIFGWLFTNSCEMPSTPTLHPRGTQTDLHRVAVHSGTAVQLVRAWMRAWMRTCILHARSLSSDSRWISRREGKKEGQLNLSLFLVQCY